MALTYPISFSSQGFFCGFFFWNKPNTHDVLLKNGSQLFYGYQILQEECGGKYWNSEAIGGFVPWLEIIVSLILTTSSPPHGGQT